jgi:hypothetical protein
MEHKFKPSEPITNTDKVFAFLSANYPMVVPIINGVKYVFPESLQLIAYFIIIIIISIVLLYTTIEVVNQIIRLPEYFN